MTPTRTPLTVRGDVPGLLCNWMPVRHDGHLRGENPGVVRILADGGVWYASAIERMVVYRSCCAAETCHVGTLAELRIDWSDRAAIYLCLAWLADRGHVCTWMLPATHGGRVEAWDGLSAWEVSAIIVSASVLRVAAGGKAVRTIDRAFRPVNVRMSIDNVGGATVVWNSTESDRDYFKAPRWCLDEHNDGTNLSPEHAGWVYARSADHLSVWFGPEVGRAAVDRINAAACADDCALLVPGGVIVPEVPDAQ